MTKMSAFATVFLLLATSFAAVGQDFKIQIGIDTTITDNRWPGAEDPTRAINWEGQKYLNFAGDEFNLFDGSNVYSGLLVQPVEGDQADDVASSITFWTANDAVERDPAAFELWGSNSPEIPLLIREDDTVVSGLNPGDLLSLDLFTKIAEGPLALPESRNAGGAAFLDDANSQTIAFDNSTVYDNYLILFPELKDRNAQNSMQIAEVQLNYDGVDVANGIFDLFDPVVGLAYFDVTPPDPFECSEPAGEQPAPGEGFWSVREWNFPTIAPNVDQITSVDAALAAAASTEPQLTCLDSNYGQITFDGYVETINNADPQGAGGGYSIDTPKQPFLSDSAGADDDFMIRALGKVIIPESGEYTIGVDGDDGFRLLIDGEVFMEFPGTTGDAFLLEFDDFEAGEHDFELVWFERGGGAFVEIFAAAGFKEALDDDFFLIGSAEGLQLGGDPIEVEVTCDTIAAERAAAGLVGDLNDDGKVDFPDFLVLSGNFNTETTMYEDGDINCSGSVDFPDFLALSGNFGASSAVAASVPEPSSLMLSIMALTTTGLVRGRRRSC